MYEYGYGLKEKLQSRKFICACILFVTSTSLLLTEYSTMNQWSQFNSWIFGIYVGGNVGSNVAYKLTKKNNIPFEETPLL